LSAARFLNPTALFDSESPSLFDSAVRILNRLLCSTPLFKLFTFFAVRLRCPNSESPSLFDSATRISDSSVRCLSPSLCSTSESPSLSDSAVRILNRLLCSTPLFNFFTFFAVRLRCSNSESPSLFDSAVRCLSPPLCSTSESPSLSDSAARMPWFAFSAARFLNRSLCPTPLLEFFTFFAVRLRCSIFRWFAFSVRLRCPNFRGSPSPKSDSAVSTAFSVQLHCSNFLSASACFDSTVRWFRQWIHCSLSEAPHVQLLCPTRLCCSIGLCPTPMFDFAVRLDASSMIVLQFRCPAALVHSSVPLCPCSSDSAFSRVRSPLPVRGGFPSKVTTVACSSRALLFVVVSIISTSGSNPERLQTSRLGCRTGSSLSLFVPTIL
jgi:hypothetical protein